jgi:DNA-binding NtrC family response regulator
MCAENDPRTARPQVDAIDEALAVEFDWPVLISGDCGADVDAVAARIHATKFGSMQVFARAAASEFPLDVPALLRHCNDLRRLAHNGTIFITDIDQLSERVQHVFLESLLPGGATHGPAGVGRLLTGTTVSLWDRVQHGLFSESLYYRLNLLHLVVDSNASPAA